MTHPDVSTGAPPATSQSAPSLVLEASTYRASVAVVSGRSVLAREDVAMRGAHEERLMPATAAVLAAAGARVSDLGHIVCGAGPGSFTSLRIAAAIAKGLVTGARPHYERGPRLASVSSLLLIVAGAAERLSSGLYVATVDALRGERYAVLAALQVPEEPASDDATGGGTAESSALERRVALQGAWRRLPAPEVSAWAATVGATVIGPDLGVEGWPDAAGLIVVSDAVKDVDPVSWQPDYGRLAEAEVRRAAASGIGRR